MIGQRMISVGIMATLPMYKHAIVAKYVEYESGSVDFMLPGLSLNFMVSRYFITPI